MKKLLQKLICYSTFMIFGFLYLMNPNRAVAQCGNVSAFTPTINKTYACSGSPITVNAPGLPIKKWIYRDSINGVWQVINTASNSVTDYPYVSKVIVRTYRAVVSTSTCPTDSTAGVSVTVTPNTYGVNNGIQISTSANTVCSGNTLNLNLLGVTGTVSGWVYKDLNTYSSFAFSSENVSDYNTTVNLNTTRTYRALVLQNNSCQIDSSATYQVSIIAPIYGNNNSVKPNINLSAICGGNSVTLSIEWSTNLVKGWVYRDNDTGVWNNFAYASNSVSDGNTNVSFTTIRKYRALLRNSNNCNVDTSDYISLNINPSVKRTLNTIVPVYTSNISFVCAGNSFYTQINGYSSSNVISWIYRDSANGTWTSGSSQSTSAYFYPNANYPKNYVREVRVVINNAATTCSIDTSAAVFVNIKAKSYGNTNFYKPVVSNNIICSGVPLQVYLPTTNVYVSNWVIRNNNTGPWQSSGSGTPYTDNNTTVTANTQKSYRALITSNANCSVDTTDEVSALIKLPVIGGNNTLIPTSTQATYCSGSTVQGNITISSKQSIYKWVYRDNNTGNWLELLYNTSNYFYDYYSNTISTTTYRAYRALVRNNESCTVDTSASVSVLISPAIRGVNNSVTPTIPINVICSGSSAQVFVNVPNGYSVQYWLYRDTVTTYWNTFGSNSSNPYDYNTNVINTKYRNYRVILQSNTSCQFDTTASLVVTINTKTPGNIGIAPSSTTSSICGGTTSFNMQVGLPSGASVQNWIYKDNNIGNWLPVQGSGTGTSYTESSNYTGVLVPTIRNYRVLINNLNTCKMDTTASLPISINPIMGGNTIAISPIVSGSSSTCNGGSASVYINYSGTVQKWLYRDNSGPWTDIVNTSTSIYDNNIRVNVSTNRQYKVVVYRAGSCYADTTQSQSVIINPYAFGNVISPSPSISQSSICAGTSASVSVALLSGQTVQKWIYRDNNSGNWLDFVSNSQTSNYNDATTNFTTNTIRSYRAIISQTGCRYDTTPGLNVTFNTPISGNQLNVQLLSTTPVVCSGTSLYVYVNSTYNGNVKKWIYRDNNGPWYDVPNSTSTAISHTNTLVNSTTTRSYRVLFNSTSCSIDSSSIYNVTINPVGNGNAFSITPTSSVTSFCSLSSSYLNLYVSVPSGYTVKKWIQKDAGGQWLDFGYTTASTSIIDYNTKVSVNTTRSYAVILTNANTCSNDTTNLVTVLLNASVFGTATSVIPTSTRANYCYGMPASINISLPSGYTVQRWIYSNNNGPVTEFENSTGSTSLTDYNTYVGTFTSRTYKVILINNNLCKTDTSAAITLNFNPRGNNFSNTNIQPTTSTPVVCSGNNAQLNVSLIGGNNVYKWIYSNSGNGGPWYDALSSYNSNSYSHNNTYTNVVVTRLYKAILADTSICAYDSTLSVTVTLNPFTYGKDSTLIPTGLDTACAGTSVSLNITIPNGSQVIKWIYRDNLSGAWQDFKTSTSSTSLFDNTVATTTGINSRSYRAIVLKNTNCSNDSSGVKTVIIKAKQNGNILTSVFAGISNVVDTLCSGSSVYMYVGATVDAWIYKDGNGPWTAIQSSANSGYTHTNTNITGSVWRYYRAMISTGACKSDTSLMDSVLLRNLTTGNNNSVVPSISSNIVCSGNYANLSVSVPSGAIIQKWIYSNNNSTWIDLSYGNSSSISDYNTYVSVNTPRYYRVIFQKNCSNDTTGTLSISINPKIWANNNTLLPTASTTTVCAGSAVSNISVVAGNGNTIMKWLYRDNNTGPWIELSNGNNNNINDYNTYVGNIVLRSYRAIIINNTACSNDTSGILNVTINPIIVGSVSSYTPTANPSSNICTGAVLGVSISVGSNSVLRWTYNINSGPWIDWGYSATSNITDYSTYYSTSTTKAYRAIVYQPANCRIDTSLALTVNINPRGFGNDNTIVPTVNNATVCYGSSTLVTVVPGSGNTVSKWLYRDNNTGAWLDIAGSSTSFTDYNYLSVNTPRSYRALISKGANCSIDTSAAVNINMNQLVPGNDNTLTPVSPVGVCTGQTVTVTMASGAYTIVKWISRDNYTGPWSVVSNSSSGSFTDYNTYVTSNVNRTYRVIVRKNNSCNTDTTAADTTTIGPRVLGNDNTIVPTVTPGTNVCTGTTINLNINPGTNNSVLKWIYKIDNGAWMDFYNGNSNSVYDYNTSVSATSVRVYKAIISKGAGCSNDSSASVTVTINPRSVGTDPSIIPSISTGTNVCSGTIVTVNITLSGSNTISKWLYRDNNAGPWLIWNVGISSSVNDYNTTVTALTNRSYRAIIAKGSGCTLDTSASANVNINTVGNGNQNSIVPTSASSVVCSGTPVSASVTGYTGTGVIKWIYRDNFTGGWNNINSSAGMITDYSTIVSATTIRSYRAVINNSANCKIDTTAMLNITINPIANGNVSTPAQTASATFCSGNAINIFINPGSGYAISQWLFRDDQGAWNNLSTSNVASIYDYNTAVSSPVQRSYRAILQNTGGCSKDSSTLVSVMINPITNGNNTTLTPTTGTTSICSGNPAIVSLNGFSGSVIKWIFRDSVINGWSSISNTSTTLIDNNTNVSYDRTRTYRAIIYNATNCSYDTTNETPLLIKQQLAGNANSIVPTSPNIVYCSGNPISLSATGFINGGTVTGWLFYDHSNAWIPIPASASASYIHTNTTVGIITVRKYRALVITGCYTDTTAEITVTIDIYPGKPIISKGSGDSLYCSENGTSYVWKNNGTVISTATTKGIVGTASGNYTVEVSNASGCKSTSDAYNFIKSGLTTLSLDRNTHVYPNPSYSGIFNLEIENETSAQINLKIYDMLGNLVMEKELNSKNGSLHTQLNLEESKSGVYLLTVESENVKLSRRLVITR